jgi:hypothetical protein
MHRPTPNPLLTVRAALILLTAIVVGLVAGALSYLANHNVPTATLIGGGAAGGAIMLFHTVLDQ